MIRFILDGCAFYCAHIWSKSGICWRHLITSKKSSNLRREKNRKRPILHHTCKHVLSYHLIQLPWNDQMVCRNRTEFRIKNQNSSTFELIFRYLFTKVSKYWERQKEEDVFDEAGFGAFLRGKIVAVRGTARIRTSLWKKTVSGSVTLLFITKSLSFERFASSAEADTALLKYLQIKEKNLKRLFDKNVLKLFF